MRSLALALLVVAVLSCATPARVSSAPVGEGVSRTVPVFVVTCPARCIDMGDIETVIPPDRDTPGAWSDGERRAIAALQRAAVNSGGDAVMLTTADLHPGMTLHGRVLQCGL